MRNAAGEVFSTVAVASVSGIRRHSRFRLIDLAWVTRNGVMSRISPGLDPLATGHVRLGLYNRNGRRFHASGCRKDSC